MGSLVTGFLCPSILDSEPGTRQTDRQTDNGHLCIMPPPYGGRGIVGVSLQMKYIKSVRNIIWAAYGVNDLSWNKSQKNVCCKEKVWRRLAFVITTSTLSCSTNSALLLILVACKFTTAARPPDFLVIRGRLAHGKIWSDVPRHKHRSACLAVTHYTLNTLGFYSQLSVDLLFWRLLQVRQGPL